METYIDGEKYNLIFLKGKLTTKQEMYEGHFEIVARKDGKYYPLKEKEKETEMSDVIKIWNKEISGCVEIIKKYNEGNLPEKEKQINSICEHLKGYLDLINSQK